MSVLDSLFRLKRADQPEEDHEGVDDEVERAYAAQLDWERRIGEVHVKPLEWGPLPAKAGLYLIREPGAPRLAWKVVDVVHNGRELRASWTDIESRPLRKLAGWQFCKVQEPRP